MKSQAKIFEQLISRGKLFHGYIFWGSAIPSLNNEQDPKLTFAQGLANYLENGVWDSENTVLIDSVSMGNGIEESREAIRFLWQRPLKSPKKTLIIPCGSDLTPEAQNAILKVSEDPPSSTLILLIAESLDSLLPTLRSRFHKVYLGQNLKPEDISKNTSADITMAEEFLKSDFKKKSDLIREVVSRDDLLENFLTGLLLTLYRDKIKNWRAIKELINRWTLIKRYNTNKRLQLESIWTNYL